MNLNFFPINIDFDKYKISTEQYSDERIKELRQKHNKTHSFFRVGDKIYISNSQEKNEISLGSIEEVKTFIDADITESLIKHVFFRTFKNHFSDRIPIDFYPFRFFSINEKDDLILSLLPQDLKGKISYKKLIEVQLRKIELNGKVQFGFVINTDRNWIFTKSCKELNAEGFDLNQVEVIHSEILPGMKNILAPNEELIGIISEIQGNNAILNTNSGNECIPLSELFIRKTHFNICNYLNFKIGPDACSRLFDVIKNRKNNIYSAEYTFEEIGRIARGLFLEIGSKKKILFQNKDGFCFTVTSQPLQIQNSIDLKSPTFIFDYPATKYSKSPDKGLNDFGPYDSTTFDIKSPNILCICHQSNRGTFSNFLAKLKDGDANSKFFKKGLQKKYELYDIKLNIKEISNYTVTEYFNAITDHIRNSNQPKPNIAIVAIPENFKKEKDQDNPYYKIKAKLLSLEIPVQFITVEKIEFCNEYIMNSIALQIYAKLGGTPWVLPTHPSVDREIIIGIGHSWIRSNQFKGAEQNRIVGITTFMSSDGQYILGEKIKDAQYDNYFQELLNSLNESIDSISKEQGWNDGDTIRLLFHIFKPIKSIEFDVISELVLKKSKFKIQFAFITISKLHPYLMFETNQNGIPDNNGKIKGKYIPDRAQNIILDPETCLIQMLGAKELKTSKHAMSSPIQIKILRPKNQIQNKELEKLLYHDLSHITQQIYAFTYLSWRGFLPSEEPATMLYSNLISNLLGKMRYVPTWDADILNYKLKRKKWFL